MARRIVLTSGKGGVGKTTVCAALGIALARKKQKTLLVDADFGLNNLDVALGMESRVVYDINDAVDGKCRLAQAILQDEALEDLYLLPSVRSDGIGFPKNVLASMLARVDEDFDFILIDCPAGIDEGFHRAVCVADEALVVTTPHPGAIRDADKVLTLLRTYPLNAVGVVVNRVRGDLVVEGKTLSADETADVLGHPAMAYVPEDDMVTVCSQLGRAGMNSPSSHALAMLADNLTEGSRKLYDCTYDYRGLFGKIRLYFRRQL